MAAPCGPWWLTVEPERDGFRWLVLDSWTGKRAATGAAPTMQRARGQAEFAAVCLEIGGSRAVAVRAAIAFGDWPADEGVRS
jgi:hypothetical protein